MTTKQMFLHISMLLVFGFFTVGSALAATVEDFQFMKISAQDHKAVVKTPEGKLRVVL